MTIHVLNYASGRFIKSQAIQNLFWSNYSNKIVVHSFNQEDYNNLKNLFPQKEILSVLKNARGDGLWAWKILFIDVIFSNCNENDIILYLDSGGLPFDNIDYIFESISLHGNFFVKVSAIEDEIKCRNWLRTTNLYENKRHLIEDGSLFLHKKWDKRSNNKISDNVIQTAGGIQGWLVNSRNKKLIKKIIENINLENYDDYTMITNMDYIEHRHDQSVLSELVEIEGLYTSEILKNIYWHKGNI